MPTFSIKTNVHYIERSAATLLLEEYLRNGLPAGARVALVPEGPYVYARADNADAFAEVPQLS